MARITEGSVTKKLYLCDGLREDCRKTICYKFAERNDRSVCRHTEDIRHAIPRKGERKFACNGEYLVEVEEGQ